MTDSDSIFLVDGAGVLERVPHRRYKSEDLLQELVDKHPELIVGEQIDPDQPPRWLVVRREAGIPGTENGTERWSVDHLLLDQHARPTLVEVKRSSDTRIRREVVGQMLDYAANAQAYWPRDKIKALATETFGGADALDRKVIELLELEPDSDAVQDIEGYWNTVERNLRNGEIRLLFVADEIPTELRRIIEFLNDHMPLVEVLGIEIRQYEGQSVRALVPRVVGQTEFARQQKRPSSRVNRLTNETEFLGSCSGDSRVFFTQLLREASARGYTIYWGQKGFSVRVSVDDEQLVSVLYGYPPGVNGSPVPLFQAYLAHITDPALHETYARAFTQYIPFELKGKHTLEIGVTNAIAANLGTKLPSILDLASAVARGDEPARNEP